MLTQREFDARTILTNFGNRLRIDKIVPGREAILLLGRAASAVEAAVRLVVAREAIHRGPVPSPT